MDVFGNKDGHKMVCITKIAPTFPHLPLEVRNAELYDYRFPDAEEKPVRMDGFSICIK